MASLPEDVLQRTAALAANGGPKAGATLFDGLAVTLELVQRLHARVLELEARSMKYCGTWAEGTVYDAGDCVTHAGRLWFSGSANNVDRPGNGKTAWKMTHK